MCFQDSMTGEPLLQVTVKVAPYFYFMVPGYIGAAALLLIGFLKKPIRKGERNGLLLSNRKKKI